ncbi:MULTISPECIES: hypothetical protein [unclassified Acetobacterium]|jgi:ABC-type microcin C transport system permease subunit YejE|nr:MULTISPECIES: hypothetical protein [unclassified Acetobacterium]MDZ5726764.1 hypothetical protein [Acetobacterium sp. K1/6]
MNNKRFYWCVFFAVFILSMPVTVLAVENPVAVTYRGHVQDVGDVPVDGS